MEFKQLVGQKKGVAGLNVYLGLIAMLFMIGVLLMVFQIAGSKLVDATAGDEVAQSAINDTRSALSTSTDMFPTFIALGGMVVLILLIVIIINSIRATGLVGGEGA